MPKNKFFQANVWLVETEIRPEHTVSYSYEVDLSRIEEIRLQAGVIRPSYTAILAKSVALALREFPYANQRIISRPWFAWWAPRLQRFLRCDIAVAVERNVPDAEGVAFVEILRDVDSTSLNELTAQLRILSTADETTSKNWKNMSRIVQSFPRILSGLLLGVPRYFPGLWVEHRGAATLISSPGKYGAQAIFGTWPWPLAFSFGQVKTSLRLGDNNEVHSVPTFTFTFNFDRRVMAGAPAAKFFRRVVDLLENPQALLTVAQGNRFPATNSQGAEDPRGVADRSPTPKTDRC